jgi:hypothetical protein
MSSLLPDEGLHILKTAAAVRKAAAANRGTPHGLQCASQCDPACDFAARSGTMAVERFSHPLYEKPDGHVFDYHDGIKRTWANLLNSYINLTTYKCHDLIAVEPPPVRATEPARPPYEANWDKYGTAKEINPHVRFKEASFKSILDLRKSTSADASRAREALKNHPGLRQHVY